MAMESATSQPRVLSAKPDERIFGVDIHPAAKIGCGIMLDHATGIVIGETAVVDDDVTMLHGVTLGGTGKEQGDRHPKIRHGVLIGASASVIGNIEIGAGAKVGAGSVVMKDVPPHVTVAGVPAEVVGRPVGASPAKDVDHHFKVFSSQCSDTCCEITINSLQREVKPSLS